MLTPEEVRELLLPVDPDYLIENGIADDSDMLEDGFYTDANGQLVTPEKLEYGKGYSLVEVQAPMGYVLDSTPVPFTVSADNADKDNTVNIIRKVGLFI